MDQTGPASDVFGLAETVYNMLTGDLPFGLGTPKNPFPQFTDDPVPVRRLRPSLPRELDDLILSCLNRSALARPGLKELLPRLNALIDKGPRMWPTDFDPVTPHNPIRKRTEGETSLKKTIERRNMSSPAALAPFDNHGV